MNDHDLGTVWSDPAVNLQSYLDTSESKETAFVRGLSEGFFSQYTTFKGRAFVKTVVDWHIDCLAEHYEDIGQYPPDYCESNLVPKSTLVDIDGRLVSPDFLRVHSYIHDIKSNDLINNKKPIILEIGSGYGNFARAIKFAYPEATVVLCDIEASLKYSEFYLRNIYSEATFLYIEDDDYDVDFKNYDFVLVPLENRVCLENRTYDLAVNIWSFGEMHDAYLADWFELLQSGANVKALYLLNAFLAPVTLASVDRLKVGQWLPKLNNDWQIIDFCIDPKIHRCRYITNYYTGISIIARKYRSQIDRETEYRYTQKAYEKILLEDWVQTANTIEDIKELLDRTEYIGRIEMDHGMDGSFFGLWNQYRINNDNWAAELLAIYIRYVQRSHYKDRVSKEEFYYATLSQSKRLTSTYQPFLDAIEHKRNSHFIPIAKSDIQGIYNKAYQTALEGNSKAAENLYFDIARSIAHSESWHQLTLLAQKSEDKELETTLNRALIAFGQIPTHTPYQKLLLELIEVGIATHQENDNGILLKVLQSLLDGKNLAEIEIEKLEHAYS